MIRWSLVFGAVTAAEVKDVKHNLKNLVRAKSVVLDSRRHAARALYQSYTNPSLISGSNGIYEPITYNSGITCDDTKNNDVWKMCPGETHRDCYGHAQPACQAYGTSWGNGLDDNYDGDDSGMPYANTRYSVCCKYVGGSSACSTPGDTSDRDDSIGGTRFGDTRCCPSSQCTKSYSSYTLPPSTSPTEAPSNSPTTAAPTAPTSAPTSSPTTLEWDACEKRTNPTDCASAEAAGRCEWEGYPEDGGTGCMCIEEACTAPGWPIYYSWGNDVDSCPCAHQSNSTYKHGVLIDSGEGCHDILTEDDCLTAFAEVFPGAPLPIFHGHVDDPNIPRGCAWTENGAFGSHNGPSFLINYHDTGSSNLDSYGHTVLCKNHDYEYPDDEYLPLFDPSSEWVEYTSNNCGPGHVNGYSASTGACPDTVINGVSYLNHKVRMVSVPVDEGNATGLMEKVTIDGCDYYGWNIYHCVGSTDTRAPTTSGPTVSPTLAPTSPTAHPTLQPTVTIPEVDVITLEGGVCDQLLTSDQCYAVRGQSRADPNCGPGGLDTNACIGSDPWPWQDVTPPMLGVPSGCVVHVDGDQQTYFWNDGTATASGNGYYQVCVKATPAPTPPPTTQPTLLGEFYEYVAASKTDYDQCYDYDPKCVEVDMGICGGPTPEPTNCSTTPCTRCCQCRATASPSAAPSASPTTAAPTMGVFCLSQTAPIAVSMQNPYLFDGAAYDSTVRLGLNLGEYIFTGVTSSHPLGFFASGISVLDGDIAGSIGGVVYYTNTIRIKVTADFGVTSYGCLIHGFMGGQDRLVFSSACETAPPTSSPTTSAPSNSPTLFPTAPTMPWVPSNMVPHYKWVDAPTCAASCDGGVDGVLDPGREKCGAKPDHFRRLRAPMARLLNGNVLTYVSTGASCTSNGCDDLTEAQCGATDSTPITYHSHYNSLASEFVTLLQEMDTINYWDDPNHIYNLYGDGDPNKDYCNQASIGPRYNNCYRGTSMAASGTGAHGCQRFVGGSNWQGLTLFNDQAATAGSVTGGAASWSSTYSLATICSCPPLSQAPTSPTPPPTDPYAGFVQTVLTTGYAYPAVYPLGTASRQYTEAQYNAYSPWDECSDNCVANNPGSICGSSYNLPCDYCMMTVLVGPQGGTHTLGWPRTYACYWTSSANYFTGQNAKYWSLELPPPPPPPSVAPTPPSAAPTAAPTTICSTFHDHSAFTQTNGCSANHLPPWAGGTSDRWQCTDKSPSQNWLVLDMQQVLPIGGLHLQPALRGGDFNMQGYNDNGWLFCWSETALAGSATWPNCINVDSPSAFQSGAYQDVDFPTDDYPGMVNARYLKFWANSPLTSPWRGPSIKDLKVKYGCAIEGWTMSPTPPPSLLAYEDSDPCLTAHDPSLTPRCFGFWKTTATTGVWGSDTGVTPDNQARYYELSGTDVYPGYDGETFFGPDGYTTLNARQQEAKFAACSDMCDAFRAAHTYLEYPNTNYPRGMCWLYQGYRCYLTPNPLDAFWDDTQTQTGDYTALATYIQEPWWNKEEYDNRPPTSFPTFATEPPTYGDCDKLQDGGMDEANPYGLATIVTASWDRASDYPAEHVLYPPYMTDSYYGSCLVPITPMTNPTSCRNGGWICPSGQCPAGKRWIAFDFGSVKAWGSLVLRPGHRSYGSTEYSLDAFNYYTLTSLPGNGATFTAGNYGSQLVGSYTVDSSLNDWQYYAPPDGRTLSRYLLIEVTAMPSDSAGIYKVRWLPDCSNITPAPSLAPTAPTPDPTTSAPSKAPTTASPTAFPSLAPSDSPTTPPPTTAAPTIETSCTPLTRNTCKGLDSATNLGIATKAECQILCDNHGQPGCCSFRLTDEPSPGYGQCRFVHDERVVDFGYAWAASNLYEFYPEDSYFGATCSYPTASPTATPSASPTTASPTTPPPTNQPTLFPSRSPTVDPTAAPSDAPSTSPTVLPTAAPTLPALVTIEYASPVADEDEVPETITGTVTADDPKCTEPGFVCRDADGNVCCGSPGSRRRLAAGDVTFVFTPTETNMSLAEIYNLASVVQVDEYVYQVTGTPDAINHVFEEVVQQQISIEVYQLEIEVPPDAVANDDDTVMNDALNTIGENLVEANAGSVESIPLVVTDADKIVIKTVEMKDPTVWARYDFDGTQSNSRWYTCTELMDIYHLHCQGVGEARAAFVQQFPALDLSSPSCNEVSCNPTTAPTHAPSTSPTESPTTSSPTFAESCCRCMVPKTNSPTPAPSDSPTVPPTIKTIGLMKQGIRERVVQDLASGRNTQTVARGRATVLRERKKTKRSFQALDRIVAQEDPDLEVFDLTDSFAELDLLRRSGVSKSERGEVAMEMMREVVKNDRSGSVKIKLDALAVTKRFNNFNEEDFDVTPVDDNVTTPIIARLGDVLYCATGTCYFAMYEAPEDVWSQRVNTLSETECTIEYCLATDCCTVTEAEPVCNFPDERDLRFNFYFCGSGGGGPENGTETESPTPSPTVDPMGLYNDEANRITVTNMAWALVTSGTCASNGCEPMSGAQGYGSSYTCETFAGELIPGLSGDLDFTSLAFNAISGTSNTYPTGCFVSGSYLAFNNVGQGNNCTATDQCVCHCPMPTAAPTTAPTNAAVQVDCHLLPTLNAQGDAAGALVNFGLTDYNETTQSVYLQPWLNWESSRFFHNDNAFPYTGTPRPTVSGWVTLLPLLDTPTPHLTDTPNCRFRLLEGGLMDLRTLDTECFSATRLSEDSTSYLFWSVVTLCYTNMNTSFCSDDNVYGDAGNGTWQSNAYTNPDEWKNAYTVYTVDHLSQCRRRWQYTNMTVERGGGVVILPQVTINSNLALEQGDEVVVLDDIQWQKYQDADDRQIVSSDYTFTVNGAPSQTELIFGNLYTFQWVMDPSVTFGGVPLKELVAVQFDDVAIEYTWSRLSPVTDDWVVVEATRYHIDGTAEGSYGSANVTTPNSLRTGLAAYADNYTLTDFMLQTTFDKVSGLYIEDEIKLTVALTWSASSRRRLSEEGRRLATANVAISTATFRIVSPTVMIEDDESTDIVMPLAVVGVLGLVGLYLVRYTNLIVSKGYVYQRV